MRTAHSTLASLLLVLATAESVAATPAIASGGFHSLILHQDGSLWVTGDVCNAEPRCGFMSPSRAFAIANALAIESEGGSNYVLLADGSILSWGANAQGQLGHGTTNDVPNPQQVIGLSQVRQFECAGGHCIALRGDGTVWTWGSGFRGALGDGTSTNRPAPIQVPGLSGITQVSATNFGSSALASDGTLWTWGGGAFPFSDAPRRDTAPARTVAIAASQSVTVFLDADGLVRTRGSNFAGELGNGSQPVPPGTQDVVVGGLPPIAAISARSGRVLALGRDGSVWSWGLNYKGSVGAGDFVRGFFDVPVRIAGIGPAVAIDAGTESSYAILADGSIYGWGGNDRGALGDNSLSQRASPVRMVGPGGVGGFDVRVPQFAANQLPFAVIRLSTLTGIVPFVVIADATQSRDSDGHIVRYEWFSSTGQIVGGEAMQSFSINQPGTYTISGVVTDNAGAAASQSYVVEGRAASTGITVNPMLVAGTDTVAGLRDDGVAFTWGFRNAVGRSVPSWQATIPGRVQNVADVVSLAIGTIGLAVLQDGRLNAWGSNSLGQIGDGTTTIRDVPVPVGGISDVAAAASGLTHTMALKKDGTVWAWGSNTAGQLGTGSGTDSKVPVQVPGLAGIKSIAIGNSFSIALDSNGALWAWGRNDRGKLGDGTRIDRATPVRVSIASPVAGIRCGDSHCFATGTNGSVSAWGINGNGELGTGGPTADVLTPVVVAALAGFTDLAPGIGYTIGLRNDGTVWTWGGNGFGQLGDGTLTSRARPEPISGIEGAVAVAASHAGGGAFALLDDGTVLGWGGNSRGEIGDGTIARRLSPVSVVDESGALFDLSLRAANVNTSSKPPLFFIRASSTASLSDATVTVENFTRFNADDVGKSGSVYAFALAPADIVKRAAPDEAVVKVGYAKSAEGKETPVPCVLAQLNTSGQLQTVSASSLQAYVTGVLGAQGSTATILNGVSAANVGGATFFISYSVGSASAISPGNNRSSVSIPGSMECKPQAPKAGWYWDPPTAALGRSPRDGTGYSIEVQGSSLFFAAFLYDDTGRSNWYVATGKTSLDGSLFTGDLLAVRGGQTLSGAYKPPAAATSAGPITLAFDTAISGTMVWPGGIVPLGRFEIVPNGLTALAQADLPENGWWWNPEESGRGFFIEWQNGHANIAGYMYDEAGNPVWYLTVVPTPDPRKIEGNWWSFANGMTLTGPWRPNVRVNDNVASLSIQFTSSTTAVLALPGGRTTPLRRFRF